MGFPHTNNPQGNIHIGNETLHQPQRTPQTSAPFKYLVLNHPTIERGGNPYQIVVECPLVSFLDNS